MALLFELHDLTSNVYTLNVVIAISYSKPCQHARSQHDQDDHLEHREDTLLEA